MLESYFGNVNVKAAVGAIVKPGEWFNVAVRWEKSKDGRTSTQVVFINGIRLAEASGPYYGAREIKRDKIVVGVAPNGAQPWRGVMDDLTVWSRPLSDEDIGQAAKSVK
jgi:hypothetical protein